MHKQVHKHLYRQMSMADEDYLSSHGSSTGLPSGFDRNKEKNYFFTYRNLKASGPIFNVNPCSQISCCFRRGRRRIAQNTQEDSPHSSFPPLLSFIGFPYSLIMFNQIPHYVNFFGRPCRLQSIARLC